MHGLYSSRTIECSTNIVICTVCKIVADQFHCSRLDTGHMVTMLHDAASVYVTLLSNGDTDVKFIFDLIRDS